MLKKLHVYHWRKASHPGRLLLSVSRGHQTSFARMNMALSFPGIQITIPLHASASCQIQLTLSTYNCNYLSLPVVYILWTVVLVRLQLLQFPYPFLFTFTRVLYMNSYHSITLNYRKRLLLTFILLCNFNTLILCFSVFMISLRTSFTSSPTHIAAISQHPLNIFLSIYHYLSVFLFSPKLPFSCSLSPQKLGLFSSTRITSIPHQKRSA